MLYGGTEKRKNMEPEEALATYLRSHPDVTVLFGERVYPAPAPEDAALPLVTYFRVSTRRVRAQQNEARLARSRIQLTVRADDYATLRQCIAVLRRVLDGYRGNMAGLDVGAVFCENDRDEFGYQARVPAGMIDVSILYVEV